jgi:hypothetical protein
MRNEDSPSEIDDGVDPVVRRAIQAMRAAKPVPPEWRAELLSKVPVRRRRSAVAWWASVGVAAALCLGIGLSAVVKARDTSSVAGVDEASHVRFSIRAPAARRVSLVGDFDLWDPAALPMRPANDGETWTLDVPLPPGRHVFAYAVDGGLRTDPTAARAVEDDFGVPSSVIVVASGRGR